MEGKESHESDASRAVSREVEELKYKSVIIKRNDQSVRHPDDTLQAAIEEGLEQHKRSNTSLFLSAISAGLMMGFSVIGVSFAAQLSQELDSELLRRLAISLFYPLGFIICIMSGSQLFTEQTATAVYPVLDKKAKLGSLGRLLSLVLGGNFVGTLIAAIMLYSTISVSDLSEGTIYVGDHILAYSALQIFMSAILAGWLMAQGGWLVMSTPPSTSQIICVYFVTFLIGIGGFHHSIAGSAELFLYALVKEGAPLFEVFKVLGMAVLGNLVGGSIFVASLNYAHIRHYE